MSSTSTPKPLDATAAPNQIELIWETHRRKFWGAAALLGVAFAVYYGVKYFNQKQVDAKWGSFATSSLLQNGYSDSEVKVPAGLEQYGFRKEDMAASQLGGDLLEQLAKAAPDELEKATAAADSVQKPFLMLLQARKAMQDREWDKADALLAKIASDFPNHTLTQASPYPIQVREEVKDKTKPEDDTQQQPPKKPKFEEPKAGSTIELLRQRIAAAKAYQAPTQFQKPEIPADAPKYRIEFSGNYGSVTVALFDKLAPKHAEKFKALVEAKHWDGICVDEVERQPKTMGAERMQMHFGFESTKTEADRSKWNTTDPSKNEVEFEATGLSHFAGALCARPGAEDKSQVDRLWITGNDTAGQGGMDGERVVFGYVTEGLENIQKICKATLSNQQEEEANKGRPSELIKIVSITAVP